MKVWKVEMKIVLLDMDIENRRRAYPNLALMKLSAYHKMQGDEVYLNFPLIMADITYASCVFTWHKRKLSADVIEGGSGINLDVELPDEIEHIMPDYELYPNIDFSLGFTSRGCFRSCPWCIVPRKEGNIHANARIYEFWDRRRKRLILMDNNLLAAPNCYQTLEDLIEEQVDTDINQGLDIRLLNEKNAQLLLMANIKKLRFAFDDLNYESHVRQGIELLLEMGVNSRNLSFYFLVGFKGDDTAMERLKILADYKVEIYPMIYKGEDGKEPGRLNWNSEDTFYHGPRRNINKFLRIAGRLPD